MAGFFPAGDVFPDAVRSPGRTGDGVCAELIFRTAIIMSKKNALFMSYIKFFNYQTLFSTFGLTEMMLMYC